MSTDHTHIIGRAVTTTAALLDRMTPAEKDELAARLEARGYKPELAASKKHHTGTSGSIASAAMAYREFNGLPIEADGLGLLKALRRPCCGLPDLSWRDPQTGKPLERAITHGRWAQGLTVKVGYRFTRIPDSGDSLSAEEVRSCFQAALDCWMSVAGIKLQLVDDINEANIQCVDAGREADRVFGAVHGVLADMMLPVGTAGESTRSRGRFDHAEEWGLRTPNRGLSPRGIDFLNVLIHELGHAWGMDHEPGQNSECLNPMYWPASHLFIAGSHWMGPKDTATMRRVYGPPVAVPPPPPPPPPPGGPQVVSQQVDGVLTGIVEKQIAGLYRVRGVFSGAARDL